MVTIIINNRLHLHVMLVDLIQSVKRGLNVSAKIIDSGQPAQSAHDDPDGKKFIFFLSIVSYQRTVLPYD